MAEHDRASVSDGVRWTGVAAAVGRYLIEHTMQLVREPGIDARHYAHQERLFVEWVGSMGRANLPAPNLMVACVVWLAGVACGILMSRRWLGVVVAATLAWMSRAFFVARVDVAGADQPDLH